MKAIKRNIWSKHWFVSPGYAYIACVIVYASDLGGIHSWCVHSDNPSLSGKITSNIDVHYQMDNKANFMTDKLSILIWLPISMICDLHLYGRKLRTCVTLFSWLPEYRMTSGLNLDPWDRIMSGIIWCLICSHLEVWNHLISHSFSNSGI